MPFQSERQKKWMFINKPEIAKRWEKESISSRLERATAPKKKGKK